MRFYHQQGTAAFSDGPLSSHLYVVDTVELSKRIHCVTILWSSREGLLGTYQKCLVTLAKAGQS